VLLAVSSNGNESTIWYIQKKEEEICSSLSEPAVPNAKVTSAESPEAWKRRKSG